MTVTISTKGALRYEAIRKAAEKLLEACENVSPISCGNEPVCAVQGRKPLSIMQRDAMRHLKQALEVESKP